jgi:hypothetical protein
MLVVMLLRRMAYNLLTLYRSVTLRAADKRAIPWRDLMRQIYNLLHCRHARPPCGAAYALNAARGDALSRAPLPPAQRR